MSSLFLLPSRWTFPKRLSFATIQPGKLKQSTQNGLRADLNNRKGPQRTFGLNSVVNSRSVFVQLKILDKMMEAVCDCGAIVSCLSSEIYNELKKTDQITLETCTRSPRAANWLPIDMKGIIRVPVHVGNKLFHREFRGLEKSEADCLLGLGFFERHKS